MIWQDVKSHTCIMVNSKNMCTWAKTYVCNIQWVISHNNFVITYFFVIASITVILCVAHDVFFCIIEIRWELQLQMLAWCCLVSNETKAIKIEMHQQLIDKVLRKGSLSRPQATTINYYKIRLRHTVYFTHK